MDYAFGDSDPAAHRLRLLAEVFAASTTPFLREVAPARPRLALDLGCGPGHTTHLVADTLFPQRAVGLDSSDRFVSVARQTETDRVSFLVHNVTTVPFPTGPADLIYSRFLLTHLTAWDKLLAHWATQLQPGGLLLLEETDWIHTTHPAFSTYLETVEAMLGDRGHVLYIGPLLDCITAPAALQRRSNQVCRLRVRNASAAGMFVLNVEVWRDHPFIREHYSLETIARLHADLAGLAHDPSDASEIEWGIRQMVFERVW